MAQRLGIAKAARLLGLSRDALQQLIRNGELITFEGQVDLDDLRNRFPALAFNQSPMIERAQIIKDAAFGERVKQHVAPTTESLERQIRRLMVDLNVERAKARKYQGLIEDLLQKIAKIDETSQDKGMVLAELNTWLLERFKGDS
jgi:CDP-4-dehydro-6-deoxyglucose reductase